MHTAWSQKVGVVLSGGGATALAHVGFLKALEENRVPIDFIGGTSMGALVGAMYASGIPVAKIDSIVRSEEFARMASGEFDDELRFYFKREDNDATMAQIKYGQGKFISNAIPTSVIDPGLMDWNFMEGFSQADAVANYNFDSLFVPFRCIASDVEHKKQVVFRNGFLNVATRASATYPFYLPPLRIDGHLLYDGGIFNNFPLDMMYQEFMPDIILGCDVSGQEESPKEDDLFSLLRTMILYRANSDNICEQLLVIEPKLENVGTFEWEKMSLAMDVGYEATMDSIQLIKTMVGREVSREDLARKRFEFNKRKQPFLVEDVRVSGLEKGQRNYVRKMMGRSGEPLPIGELKIPYFRVFEDEKVRSIFPTANYNPITGKFALNLDVKKEKDLFIRVGGNFSSRSINTGFFGLRYHMFGRSSATFEANSYFGRFYASGHAALRWDASGSWPVSLQGFFTLNRWDYYRSLSTFFEDVKPSFILLNERFGGLSITVPAGNKGMIRAEAMYTHQYDQYYQTQQFLSVDTADQTDFNATILRTYWERNTFNRRQYASSGTYLNVSAKYVNGEEITIPGTTSALRDSARFKHEWLVLKLSYQNYFLPLKAFHLGFMVEGVYSTQGFFSNYTASSIASPAFQPIPESRTFFLPQFRAHKYVAGGLMGVFHLSKSLDLRAEAYAFNAFGQLEPSSLNLAEYNSGFLPRYIGSSSLVFHSPFGPLSLSTNYYHLKERPWSVLFNFGYILFNRSPRD
jgi:NTE family protein